MTSSCQEIGVAHGVAYTPALVVAARAVRAARYPDLWTGSAHGRASASLHGIPGQPALDRLHRPDASSSCPSVDRVIRFGKRDDPPGRQPRSAGGQPHEADGERRLAGPHTPTDRCGYHLRSTDSLPRPPSGPHRSTERRALAAFERLT